MSDNDPECLFCRIVAGAVPADLVHETDLTVAFRDIEPQAPVHVLVVPRQHHPDAFSVAQEQPEALVDMFQTAGLIAKQEGLDDGYRSVFNTGRGANQLVFHAHLHVLGGRTMTWPPG